MTPRPIIGITAKQSDAAWVSERVGPYLDAVQREGGLPRLLAPGLVEALPGSLSAPIHGLLLSGGGDIHPRRYGQPLAGAELESIDETRDDLELRLAHVALDADLPILAICRGLQVLNVSLGGGLVQHVDSHRPLPPDEVTWHEVSLVKGTRLASILGNVAAARANSSHHQAIDDDTLANGLTVTARSLPDHAVIEAVESPQHNWVIGVQWHPERSAEVPDMHQRLFHWFVVAAREEMKRRSYR